MNYEYDDDSVTAEGMALVRAKAAPFLAGRSFRPFQKAVAISDLTEAEREELASAFETEFARIESDPGF